MSTRATHASPRRLGTVAVGRPSPTGRARRDSRARTHTSTHQLRATLVAGGLRDGRLPCPHSGGYPRPLSGTSGLRLGATLCSSGGPRARWLPRSAPGVPSCSAELPPPPPLQSPVFLFSDPSSALFARGPPSPASSLLARPSFFPCLVPKTSRPLQSPELHSPFRDPPPCPGPPLSAVPRLYLLNPLRSRGSPYPALVGPHISLGLFPKLTSLSLVSEALLFFPEFFVRFY